MHPGIVGQTTSFNRRSKRNRLAKRERQAFPCDRVLQNPRDPYQGDGSIGDPLELPRHRDSASLHSRHRHTFLPPCDLEEAIEEVLPIQLSVSGDENNTDAVAHP
jgi:hypothetical protein